MNSDRKPFQPPVLVSIDGGDVVVGDTVAARDLLMSTDWPGARGDAHEKALDACLKVLDGHRSVADARAAFVEAALSADVLGHPA